MSSEPLPALISELTISDCDSERTKTKMRFTEHFQVIDTKLNHLLKMTATNLSTVVDISSRTIDALSNTKAKCHDLKCRITQCKDVLQCKRDEIRKLWLDSLEHKYVHQMLGEIQNLSKTSDKVTKLLHSKKYISATEILVSSICLLEGELNDVEALSQLKIEMNCLKEKLYMIFIEELRQELYWSTFHFSYNAVSPSSDENVAYEKIFRLQQCLKINSHTATLNSSYVKILLECIGMLQKWPETFEQLKDGCQTELSRIVLKLSKLMFDILQKSIDQPIQNLPETTQQNFLLDLLQTIFDHFKRIALNHREFSNVLENMFPTFYSYDSFMQAADVFSNIQTTIELFISSYLEQQPLINSASLVKASIFSSSQNLSDLSVFFEAHVDRECPNLFKFSNSLKGLQKNKKIPNEEQSLKPNYSSGDINFKNLTLVCKPAVKNITFIFVPLKKFVLEIESMLHIEAGAHCPLYSFLCDSAHAFLDQVSTEISKILENASASLELWSVSAVPGDEVNSDKRILSSTLVLNNNLVELQLLLKSLPDYSNHFLHLIYYVVLEYKDMLLNAFKTLFSEDHNILSVSWAKDRDIRRLLKSFSNWKHLEDAQTKEVTAFPEDVRLRNKAESQLLIRNLHSEEYGSWEIITDFNILLNLAILQESSQWFSVQLVKSVNELVQFDSGSNSNSVTGLKKLGKEYEAFADVCLLALHLEVRTHCFHYLLPSPELEVTFDIFFHQDFESSARNLTADLAMIEETLRPVLTSKELKYIFEGVGEMIASILIHNVSCMNVTNEALVKKINRGIFVIQCGLGNITLSREVSLERARQYIQLLDQNCEDVLNEIMEEGPIASEVEYISIFKLILTKDISTGKTLDDYVSKLGEIFKRVSVNI